MHDAGAGEVELIADIIASSPCNRIVFAIHVWNLSFSPRATTGFFRRFWLYIIPWYVPTAARPPQVHHLYLSHLTAWSYPAPTMSSSPAPGLGNHPSLSTEKIDHLLSAQAETPASLELDRPPQPRYSYDIKAASISSRVASTIPQWRPLHLRTSFIIANVIILLALALVAELLYFLNSNARGWEPSPWLLSHSGFVPYVAVLPGACDIGVVTGHRTLDHRFSQSNATPLSGLLGWILIQPWMEIDRLVKVVQVRPFHVILFARANQQFRWASLM